MVFYKQNWKSLFSWKTQVSLVETMVFLIFVMKTWYLRTFLAVILVRAVCGFNTIKRTFLRKPFSRWNKNFPAFAKNQFWHQMDPYGRYGRTTTSVLHGISKRIQWDESRGPKPRFVVFVFCFWFLFSRCLWLDHHFLIGQVVCAWYAWQHRGQLEISSRFIHGGDVGANHDRRANI